MKYIQTTIVLALALLIAAPTIAQAQSCAPVSTSPGNFNYDSSAETTELLKKIEKESNLARVSVEQVKAMERTPMRTSRSVIATETAKIRLSAKTMAADVCRLQQITPGAKPWQVDNVSAVVSHVRALVDNLKSAIEIANYSGRTTEEFMASTSNMRDSATALGRAASPGLAVHATD